MRKRHARTERATRLTARQHAVRIASLMRKTSVWDQEAVYVVKFAKEIVPWLDQASDDLDLSARVAALEQVVANIRGDVSDFDRRDLMREARCFYDFYVLQPEPSPRTVAARWLAKTEA
jgi:hypothetical protein